MKGVNLVLVVTIILLAISSNPVNGSLLEDFEDGNYTSNPVWEQTGTYHWHEVVDSPTDATNKVIRIHGSEEGASRLVTNIDESIKIRDFHFSYDFYVSQYDFYPKNILKTESSNIVLGMTCDWDIEGEIIFITSIDYPNWGTYSTYPSSIFELNTWHKYVAYYDESNDGIVQQLYNVQTDTLVATVFHSLSGVNLDTNLNISSLYFGCEETTWQYFDNISLTPEPATILLLALGAMMLRKRKLHKI